MQFNINKNCLAKQQQQKIEIFVKWAKYYEEIKSDCIIQRLEMSVNYGNVSE